MFILRSFFFVLVFINEKIYLLGPNEHIPAKFLSNLNVLGMQTENDNEKCTKQNRLTLRIKNIPI